MTGPLRDGHISVEDLGEPDPLPAELADELERDEAGGDEPADGAGDALLASKADWFARIVRVLFRVAGMAGGYRLPRAVKATVRGLWELDAAEAAEIGELLAPVVPDRLVQSRAGRAAGAIGVALGVVKLAGAISERAEQTAQIRHEVIVHARPTAGAEPAPDAGAGRPGTRRGSDDRPAPLQPDAARAPAPVDGFSGAGLGLGEGE